MSEVDATVDLSDETRLALALDEPPPDAADGSETSGDADGPHRRRTLWSDLGRLVSTPARRGRLAVWLVVLGIAVAGPLVARSSVSDARVEAGAKGAERSGAAGERAATEAAEEIATAEQAAGADLAAQARAAHNEQRQRLAGIGLNEQTIDAFLVEVSANAELVEFRRDKEAATVDRQAAEIPQMQECVRVASRALNGAWNSATFGDNPPPAPSDLCRALLAAGT